MYMSNHPDTLVAYAKWYGHVEEIITSAEMTAIDTKSMTLTCTLKDGSKKVARVEISPPLSGYDDVKPRLLEMKAIAQEGLGMIKAPKITKFQLSISTLQTAIPIILLIYCTFFPKESTSLFYFPAKFLYPYVVRGLLQFSWGILVVSHGLESIYTYSLCRRHGTGFLAGAAYVVATLTFGFPIWRDLRKRIQAARIESVMKIE